MKRKLMSLVLALAMICSLFVPAMAAEETPAYVIPDVAGKLVILHTNDTHGADEAKAGTSIGTAGVAQLKKDFEAAGAEVILMSAGDTVMGGPLVSISKGEAAIKFMNAAKYDVMTIGNHEMDYGYENLKALIKIAEFPVLGANVVDSTTKKPVLETSKIFTTASGLKVGVFGLATPETLTKADASKMKGITFSDKPEDLYATAKAQVEALKKDGAEFIVCLGHLGVDEGSAGLRSVDVCNNVEGIDLFVDGHSHTVMENGKPYLKEGEINIFPTYENKSETLIVSTGTGLANVGVVIYDKTAKTLTSDLVSSGEYSKTDADIAAMVKAVIDDNKVKYGDKIASTEVDLNGSRTGGKEDKATNGTKVDFPNNTGVRTAETNLGDFAADAILWQARNVLGNDKVDAALTNGGGIRQTVAKGDVSKLDLLTVFPFGNTVVTIDVTGAQLLEALEAAAATLPAATGSFAQVSGIEYAVNTAVEFKSNEKYPLSTFKKPAEPGSRVTIVAVNDKPFDAAATYTLATNDFTANGGDSYCVFKGIPMKYTGKTLDEALVGYVTGELKGVITAEKYGETADRILVIPSDVKPGAWYTDAVYYVLAEGIMTGTGGNAFNLSGTVTRATVYQMLYNMAGEPTVAEDVVVTDVAGKWYGNAVRWAKSVGLFEGESFGADAVIARAEIASIISDYAVMNRILVDTSGMAMKEAADYDKIPAEFLPGMTFCYYAGIMTGNQSGMLLPNDSVTRDVLAQVMFKFAKLTPSYTEEVVEIKVPATSGIPAHTVMGTLTVPTTATKTNKAPAVVMLHGTGSNRDEAGGGYVMAAANMAFNDIATLRIDFMGTAADKTAEYKDYNYTSANIDAKAAADYLAKLENIDGKNLGVMGWSQGGTNALLAAAKYPTTFKAVVTWAGAIDLTILFGDQAGFDAAYATAKKDGSYTMKLDWRTPSDLPVGVKWFEDVKNTAVLNEVAKITAPIFAIHGDKDTTVDPESAAKIVTASKNTASETHMIADCDHTFNVFSDNTAAIYDAIYASTEFFATQFGLIDAAAAA